VLSRAGLWSVQYSRLARCLGAIGLHLDHNPFDLNTPSLEIDACHKRCRLAHSEVIEQRRILAKHSGRSERLPV
jgi:hypothetical protein